MGQKPVSSARSILGDKMLNMPHPEDEGQPGRSEHRQQVGFSTQSGGGRYDISANHVPVTPPICCAHNLAVRYLRA